MTHTKNPTKWIQRALQDHKKKSLHKQLHVKQNEPIPTEKLNGKISAKKAGGKMTKRTLVALTLKRLSKNKSTGQRKPAHVTAKRASTKTQITKPMALRKSPHKKSHT